MCGVGIRHRGHTKNAPLPRYIWLSAEFRLCKVENKGGYEVVFWSLNELYVRSWLYRGEWSESG